MYILEGRKRTNLLHTSIEPPKLKSIVKCSSIPLLPQNSVYTSSHLRIFLLLFISIRLFYPQRHPLSPTPFRIFYPRLYIYIPFSFAFRFLYVFFFCALLLSCVWMGPSSPLFCFSYAHGVPPKNDPYLKGLKLDPQTLPRFECRPAGRKFSQMQFFCLIFLK